MALWRESLLAKKVLEGRTKGYKNHPQLLRFRNSGDPEKYINLYLSYLVEEARNRGYNFDLVKVDWDLCSGEPCFLNVTTGQLQFEKHHLLSKLLIRDRQRYEQLVALAELEPHPLFRVIAGEVEEWENG